MIIWPKETLNGWAIYKFLGLTVGCVNSKTDHTIRPKEYECDVVYATNNEIGFDYLRDNLKGDYESLCFKKMHLQS